LRIVMLQKCLLITLHYQDKKLTYIIKK